MEQYRSQYVEHGYTVIPDLLCGDRLAAVLQAVEAQYDLEGCNGGKELSQTLDDPSNPGVRRLCNLMSKGREFLAMATEPLVLDFARLTIGETARWQAMNAHGPIPHRPEARQPLHADRMFFPSCAGYFNVIWCLDSFTASNGATRLIPGSHRWPWPVGLHDPHKTMAGELQVECAAGSAIFTHGDLWHAGRQQRLLHTRLSLPLSWLTMIVVGVGNPMHTKTAGCANMPEAPPAASSKGSSSHSLTNTRTHGATRRAIHLGFACDATAPQYDIAAGFSRGGDAGYAAVPLLGDVAAALLPRSLAEFS